MNLEILNIASSTPERFNELLKLPSFRKATRAMALACSSIESACFANEKIRSIAASEPLRFGLVLGSAFGELETTKDFLITFANSGVARPLLFQNSLHNSTTGFASIFFHFTGPVVTVSHGTFAFEHGLELASLILEQKQCDFVVVTYAETMVQALAEGAQEISLSAVLSTQEICAREGLQSLGTITDVTCRRAKASPAPDYRAICDSAPLAIRTLQESLPPIQALRKFQTLTLKRNDGAESTIELKFDPVNLAAAKQMPS